ncbi:MAG: DUF58 domain-containing protein [Thermoplasmata archaeon]
MRSSLLGTVLLTFAIAFAFAGVLYSNLSWIVVTVGLLCAFTYAHMRFADEIRRTDLQIERTVLDDMILTDEPVGIKVAVLNRGQTAIRGTFEDLIPRDCTISAGQNRIDTVLPPRSILTMSYSITPQKRGSHDIAGMKIEREDAFGLYLEDQVISQRTGLSAHTRKESFQTARKMAGREHLEFSGVSRSPAIVLRELEFEGIREYIPGDRARDIQWKLLPKLGKLMTKTYRKEGVLQTMIFVDSGRSMRLEAYSVAKVDHALDLAVQLSNVLLSSLHPAGVAIFDEVKVLDKANPALGRHQFEKITGVLRSVPGSFRAKETETSPVEKPAPNPQLKAKNSQTKANEDTGKFLSTVEDLAKARKGRGLGLGLDGAINEIIAVSQGREQLFIVITDLISSREAVIAGARICKRTGNKMLVIHTYDEWYRRPADLSQADELERQYENLSQSLNIEGLLRALGASYIRIGPADTATGIVRAIRRGKA